MDGVKATEILMDGNRAVGIRAIDLRNGGTITINAGAVVLATGGFGYNLERIAQINPAFEGFLTNNTPGATGDGMWMAEAVGGALVHMEHIQTIPLVHRPTRMIIGDGLRGPGVNGGAIFLNTSGRRFTDETGFRDVVSVAINAQDQGEIVVLFNERQLRTAVADAMELYDMGIISPMHTLEEVAAFVGVPMVVIRQTLEEWANFVALPNDAQKRGRDPHASPGSQYTGNNDLSEGPWYAVWMTPGIHYTMGGLATDLFTQVLASNGLSVTEIPGNNTHASTGETFNRDGIRITGTPIPGLFAAGEITGGTHGGNRQGGNAVLAIQIFGRTAGYNAARYANNLPLGIPAGFTSPNF